MTFWTRLLGLPFAVDIIDAKGTKTRRLKAGAGTPVICLHGVGGHLESFVSVTPPLAGMHEVHLLDMLGHGFTDKVSVPLTIDRTAEHVLNYMDAVGIERAHFIGQSLGAWTSAWIAAYHPQRVDSVILTATAGSPIAGFADPKVGEGARAGQIAGILCDDVAQTHERLAKMLKHPEQMTEEFAAVRQSFYSDPRFRGAIDSLLALTHVEHFSTYCLGPELLGRIQCEVLLIWGDEKIEANANSPAFLQTGLAKQKLVVFKDCGHWPPYERPDDYARIALGFFKGGLGSVEAGLQ